MAQNILQKLKADKVHRIDVNFKIKETLISKLLKKL